MREISLCCSIFQDVNKEMSSIFLHLHIWMGKIKFDPSVIFISGGVGLILFFYFLYSECDQWDTFKAELFLISDHYTGDERSDLPMPFIKIELSSDYTEVEMPNVKDVCKNTMEHPVKEFACERCEKSYTRKTSLQHHVRWECGNKSPFQCFYCHHRCKAKPRWLGHIKKQHPEKYIDYEDELLAYKPRIKFNRRNRITDCCLRDRRLV